VGPPPTWAVEAQAGCCSAWNGESFQNPLEPPSAIPGQGRRSRESGCGVTRDLEPLSLPSIDFVNQRPQSRRGLIDLLLPLEGAVCPKVSSNPSGWGESNEMQAS
jgi:hypothetical protein